MWWRNAAVRTAVVVAALILAGCGFRPLYGTSSASGDQEVIQQLAKISIPVIPDRRGQVLRNMLEERLQPRGTDGVPLYRLAIRLDQNIQNLGIREDATSSRANLSVVATFALFDGDRQLVREQAQAVVSYNILDDQYATIASEADAEDRALRRIADEMRRRLAVYFDGRINQAS